MSNTRMVGASPVTVGHFTYGLDYKNVHEWGDGTSLTIGNFCSIAKDAQFILSGNHRVDWITTFPFGKMHSDTFKISPAKNVCVTNGPITIGNDVWISSGVTILSGVTIGDGAVIAANSTVTRDVGPYEVVGGSPARLIRPRFDQKIINKLLMLRWWEFSLDRIKEIVESITQEPTEELLDELISKYRN